MFGLFSEVGPYTLDADMKISMKEYTWNTEFGVCALP